MFPGVKAEVRIQDMDTEIRTQQDPGWHLWQTDVAWVVEVAVYPCLKNFYWHVGLCSK